jgi:hypothetical protein
MAAAAIHALTEAETDRYVGALVGNAAVTELRSFLANLDLPDPADLLDGKAKFTHDRDRMDRTMAVFSSCAALVAPKSAEARNTRGAALWALLNDHMALAADIVWPAVRALCNRETLLIRIDGKMCKDAEAVLARLKPLFKAAGLLAGA